MHGRKRADPNQVESDEQRNQRIAKIEKYKNLSSFLLGQMKKEVYDQETLAVNESLLSVNPEFYTLWAYRKKFMERVLSQDADENCKISEVELRLVEKALKRNPKSYVAWHHRKWVVGKGFVDLKNELALCNQFLALDSRNFHCWSYRQFIVEKSGEPQLNEFDYTTKLINQNFSNYSAWHYRSVLLGKIGSNDPEFFKNQLEKEFEMVQSAFFTEPDDQSAWLYHRWLLSKVSPLINSTTNLHLKLQPNLNQNFGDVSRLKAELALTEELLANEPNCKWALLTVAVLVLALDKAGEDTKKSKDNISALFSHIISLDPMRKGYFQDVLKSLA